MVSQYASLDTLIRVLTPNYLTFFISNISINSNLVFGRLTTRVSHPSIDSFKTKGTVNSPKYYFILFRNEREKCQNLAYRRKSLDESFLQLQTHRIQLQDSL